MVLRNPPVIVAPDENPCHAIWTEFVAISEIDVTCGDRNIRSNLTNSWHRVRFDSRASRALAKVVSDGSTAILQFIDGTEQHGVLGVEFHVPVEIMAVKRFEPLSV